jgi:hypothetical protein
MRHVPLARTVGVRAGNDATLEPDGSGPREAQRICDVLCFCSNAGPSVLRKMPGPVASSVTISAISLCPSSMHLISPRARFSLGSTLSKAGSLTLAFLGVIPFATFFATAKASLRSRCGTAYFALY